jgi:hypothetical protein
MEDEGDDGRALHEVHPVLSQPVEGLQEQQQHEQGHELGRKIVPEDTKKEFSVKQNNVFFFSVSVLRIQRAFPRSEFFFPSRIRGQESTQSWIRIRNKEFRYF